MDKNNEEKHLNPKKMLAKIKYEENKIKMPIKNMCYKNDPPAFITVVGSKNSGKSSLIKSLVKKFTKHNIDDLKGPITLTAGRDKRITLFECNDNIHQFVDSAKVSDMVIFVIDATIGLECLTFEYLSLLMSHGLPKVMFVVTHTDKNNDKKLFKKIKKQIYDEVCEGLKFFYLGMKDGKYNDSEILNMTRAISNMKYRPIEWKCTHPHIVIDKIDENNVYGYVRGSSINKKVDVHIPGLYDTKINNFEILEDPVPIKKEGRLTNKKIYMYAPMIYKEHLELDEIEEKGSDIEIEHVEEIRLFKKSKKLINEHKIKDLQEFVEIIPKVEDENKSESETSSTEEEEESFDNLKLEIKNKFSKEAETEEDFVEKFNEKYKEKNTTCENFLLQEKQNFEEIKTRNEELKLRDVAYPGEYIKIELDENLKINLDFSKIIILGSYPVSETKQEILQGKIKTNKLYGKQLKTNDPLIFSVGWRRFQSIPVYSSKTSGENRMLKYSFKHGFCLINFYGAVVPPGTGFSVYSEKSKFRVIGYGNIMDVTGEHNLVKKLKLVGYPKKIMGNTAFIKDMFTSDLEVHKFKNAKIKSVSGLKGVVKNSVGKKGEFRGAFEGEMLMSDIVTLNCFVSYPVQKVMIPVKNLYSTWKGLRSLREIREEYDIKIEDKYIEEVSDEDIEDLKESSKEFELPEELERKLPLDKRNIIVCNEKIELPISPEEKKRKEFENEINKMRVKKEAELIKEKEKIDQKIRKETDILLKEKAEKLKKTIIKSSAKKKRISKK